MRLYWILGLLCVGCATLPQGPGAVSSKDTPQQETVYLLPLDQAMMATRLLFEQRMRFDVFERDGGRELFTSAREPGVRATSRTENHTVLRYYVKGERVGPRQSVVRIFRLNYEKMLDEIEKKPQEIGKAEEEEYYASKRGVFDRDPFAEAPVLEGFKFVRGIRDLEIEQMLLERLEMMPALEVVGGASPAPVRSIVVDAAGEASAAQSAPAECGAPLAGAESLLVQGHTLLLADPLGTRELPAAAAQLLCDASAKGMPVALGLSIPSSEQALLEQYLASAGQASDVEMLLMRGTFWRRTYQDGRSSRSMLWLIEQARRLRASGRAVSVVAFDSVKASGNEREEEMARNVLAFRQKNPDAWMLVMAGDVHVRTGSVGWDSRFQPLGARLSLALPSVRALDVGFARGSQFVCRSNVWEEVECNIYGISPSEKVRQAPGAPNGVQLFAEPSPEGFHGRIFVGALTAATPALRPAARPGAASQQASPTP